MTPNSILLDSSVVIRHFRDANVLSGKLALFEELYVPAPALAELYYGAYRSERTLLHLERFLSAAHVLTPDKETSKTYGKLAAELARAGTPIPQNDIWIAALSIQSSLPLATTDLHFQHVPGLHALFW